MSGWGSSVTERPEVQDENVGRAGFSQGLTPWLVDGHLPCVLTWPSICTCPNLLLRTLIRLDCDSNGSTLMTTFNLNHHLEDSTSKRSHIPRSWGSWL